MPGKLVKGRRSVRQRSGWLKGCCGGSVSPAARGSVDANCFGGGRSARREHEGIDKCLVASVNAQSVSREPVSRGEPPMPTESRQAGRTRTIAVRLRTTDCEQSGFATRSGCAVATSDSGESGTGLAMSAGPSEAALKLAARPFSPGRPGRAVTTSTLAPRRPAATGVGLRVLPRCAQSWYSPRPAGDLLPPFSAVRRSRRTAAQPTREE